MTNRITAITSSPTGQPRFGSFATTRAACKMRPFDFVWSQVRMQIYWAMQGTVVQLRKIGFR